PFHFGPFGRFPAPAHCARAAARARHARCELSTRPAVQLVSQTTPFVECAAGGGADPAPFVIASLAPGLSVEDTSIGPLRERLPRNEAATLVVLAGADAAGRGARAVETIVGYFRLAEPFASAGAPRSVVTSIPGLRGGLRQALELGRDRTVRESDR